MTARTTTALRVMMLVVIAVVALANAIGWVDPDLWIPFVCIIAVMGVGTRGGVLDSMRFVLLEVAVVLILGVATFSGSRDFVWAASVAVSVLAVGKIALLEMHRADSAGSRAPRRASGRSSGSPAPPREPQTGDAAVGLPHETTEDSEPAQPLGTVAAGELERGASAAASELAEAGAGGPKSLEADAGGAAGSAPAPRKRRERDDPTPVHRIAGPGLGR